MNKKGIITEAVVVSFVVILLFLSLAINLQANPEFNEENSIEKTRKSVGYSIRSVNTAPTITFSGAERQDMCKLAVAQAGVQEDTTVSDGLTPYHRWAASAATKSAYGAQYGTQWYNDYKFYPFWCVMFVNWCADQAGLASSNYAYAHTANEPARGFYSGKGRLSSNKSDSGLEEGWVYSCSSHMRLYVGKYGDGTNKWVDGNSYDTLYEPARYYVSFNNRDRSGFIAYGKPYFRAKITYYTNGGSVSGSTIYTEEKGLSTLPTPTRSGYKFAGWFEYPDFSNGVKTSISTTDRGVKKYYAKWAAAKKNIYYDLKGGYWDGSAGASTFNVDAGYTIPKNVKKSNGSVFVNWYNSSYTTVWTSIPAGHNSDVYLYARYKAPITYKLNGGSISGTIPLWYTEGVGLALPTPTRSNCSFQGWYYDASFSSKVPSNTIPTSKTGSVTVYAKWSATITCNSKIGAWKTAPTVTNANKTMTYYPGTSSSNPGISNGNSLYTASDLSYEGNWSYFAGWYTASSIAATTGPLYKIGDFTSGGSWPWTGNLTLYARWIGYNYKIYLHASSRGNVDLSKNSPYVRTSAGEYNRDYTYRYNNNTYSLPASSTVSRRGHTFKGWYNNSSYIGNVYTSTDQRTGGNKHYYAKWQVNQYDLSLHTYRGKVTDTSYTFTDVGVPGHWYRYDRKYTYSDTNAFKLPTQPATIDRRGHNFNGWYKNDSYTGTMYTAIPAETIDKQTYYAKWTPKVYKLTLHTEGATVHNTRIDNGKVQNGDIVGTYTYGKGSTFPVANSDIEKNGRIFAGWYANKNHTGNHQTGIRSGDDDTAPIDDKEYWARWIKYDPEPSVSESNEVINGELVSYIYQTVKVKMSGASSSRSYDSALKKKRKFGIKLTLDSTTATNNREVKVWLSTSTNPANVDARLDWTMSTNSTTKKYDSKSKVYTINDKNTTITYTCPNDVAENFLNKIGSRKVYVHVQTETGNRSYITVNLVRRIVYQQH